MDPAGSLHKLGGNILLLHVAPYLGLEASLYLAATSHFYRALLLYHTLTHNTIPARLLLPGRLPSSALGAVRDIEIGTNLSFTDLLWILEGGMLPAFTALTITENQHIARELLYVDLDQLRTLSVGFTTIIEFLDDPASTGMLRSLRSLTLDYNYGFFNPQSFLPQNLLRALGPASELRRLAISTDKWWASDGYDSMVLALLAAFSVPGSAPSKLNLLRLAFDYNRNDGDRPSAIVAARRSSLAHVMSPWRLEQLPRTLSTWNNTHESWYRGCGPTLFRLSKEEINALIELDQETWQRSRLCDFLVGPVSVPGDMLAHIGPLGTAVEGIEVDMSCHHLPPIFNPSIKFILLQFRANKPISAAPATLLLATSPWLKSLALYTDYGQSERLTVYPRIYEALVLPAIPNLTIFRIDVRLLLRAGQRRKCGLSQTPHAAARYELGWIPKVKKLRLDGWAGCSTCWRDCGSGTLRNYIMHGAGGAGMVTVRGIFCLFGETEEEVGCEELWEMYCLTPEQWQRAKV